MVQMALFRSTLDTAYGELKLAVDTDGVLVELWLPNRGRAASTRPPFPRAAAAGMRDAQQQLVEYFSARRRSFDLPLAPRGTPFEQRVWRRLGEIPYGTTISYGAIAAEFGLENGARAVGRVIGADGTLTGFGGGLPLKRALLELEGAIAPDPPRLL